MTRPSVYSIDADCGQRLSLIRADEELLAAAKAKFTLQMIYKRELVSLPEQTDVLLALLSHKQTDGIGTFRESGLIELISTHFVAIAL